MKRIFQVLLALALYALFFQIYGYGQTLAGTLTVQKWTKTTGIINAAITANQNDFAPTGIANAAAVRLSADTARSITGLAPGTTPDGRHLYVVNVDTADAITLVNESASSTAANRFALGADVVLAAGGSGIELMYDDTSHRWRSYSGSGTGGGGGGSGGTVTSVALDLPSVLFDVTGSPVTTSGTLTGSLKTQTANQVWAGPASGAAATPAFRALVAADIPSLTLAKISDAGTMAAAATTSYYTKTATDTLLGSYLTTAAAALAYQPLNAKLTAIGGLANAAGWLHNNGSGTFAYSTPTSSDVGLGNVENTALSTWAGSANLVTVGTITTGVWHGTAIANANLANSAVTIGSTSISLGGTAVSISGLKLGSLTTNGFVKTSSLDGTLSVDTSTYLTTATAALTYQPVDADLTALAAFASTGIAVRTATDTWAQRTITGTSNRISLTNGAGIAGNPTVDIDAAYVGQSSITTLGTVATGIWNGTAIGDTYISSASTWNSKQAGDATLTALAAYNTNGLLTQTAADTFTGRTVTGTSARISITNGNGVSGNPTIDIDSAYVGQSTITTLGTVATGTWSATTIAANKGGTGQTTFAVGDLLYASTTSALSKLAAVATGQVLISQGTSTAPIWSATPTLSTLALTQTRPELTFTYTSTTAKGRIQQSAANSLFIYNNLSFDGTNFQRDDVTFNGAAFGMATTTTAWSFNWYSTPTATNPATVTARMTLDATGLSLTNGLAVTGTISAGGAISSGVNGEGIFLAPITGTAAAYMRFQNTGGASYIGMDSSTASAFGVGNYSFALYAATDIVFVRGGAEKARATSTGLAVTGTLSSTGAISTSVASSTPFTSTSSGYTSDYRGIAITIAAGNDVAIFGQAGSTYTSLGLMATDTFIYAPLNFSVSVAGSLRGRFSSTGLTVNGAVNSTTGFSIASVALTSGNYYLQVIASSGADRTLVLAGVSGVSNGFVVGYTHSGTTMYYQMNGGNLTLGGNISVGATAGGSIFFSSGTSSTTQVFFGNANGNVGSIVTSGSATAYNTSSDQRLKKNIRILPDSGKVIDALRPVLFDWKNGDTPNTYGFIAQEVYKVFPQAVTVGDLDNRAKIKDQWAMDASKFMPVVVSELQSLRARVAVLEKKFAL